MDTKSTELYIGFWMGVVLTAIIFTFILVHGYVEKGFLRANNIYLDGKYYKLCERRCK